MYVFSKQQSNYSIDKFEKIETPFSQSLFFKLTLQKEDPLQFVNGRDFSKTRIYQNSSF
jgi:abortive infection bacteriophage resistance protein